MKKSSTAPVPSAHLVQRIKVAEANARKANTRLEEARLERDTLREFVKDVANPDSEVSTLDKEALAKKAQRVLNKSFA